MKKSILILLPVMLLAFSCARSKREGKKQHEKAKTHSQIQDLSNTQFASDPNACSQTFVNLYNDAISAMNDYQSNLASPNSSNLLMEILYSCQDFQNANNGYPSCLALVGNEVKQIDSSNELRTECEFYYNYYTNNK